MADPTGFGESNSQRFQEYIFLTYYLSITYLKSLGFIPAISSLRSLRFSAFSACPPTRRALLLFLHLQNITHRDHPKSSIIIKKARQTTGSNSILTSNYQESTPTFPNHFFDCVTIKIPPIINKKEMISACVG